MIFFTSLCASAQARSFDCRTDALPQKRAQERVRAVQAAYQSVKTLQARFVQESYLAALDVSEQSSGSMIFAKPGRMRWDYEKPEEQLFLVSDGRALLYQPTQRQVLIQPLQDVFITDLPAAFIMGIGDLTKDFTLISACGAAEGLLLELAASKAAAAPYAGAQNQSLKTFKLLVHAATLLPIGAQVADVGGNITSILLQSPKVNATPAAQAFDFTPPQGTDVVDQRE